MSLTASVERHDLALADAFTIARGTKETVVRHVVELEDDAGRVGYGAAAPSAYYGETAQSVAATLPELLRVVTDLDDPVAHQRIQRRLREVAPDSPGARAAVSIAVHDLAARRHEEPLYRRLGLDAAAAPRTSYTVGIADPETMAERAAAIVDRGFDRLKVKLGTDADRARLEAVREAAPGASIRVDANGAWEPTAAIQALEWLAELDVELLEQPVAAGDLAGLANVRGAASIPVLADESCVTATDVAAVATAVDGIVVKLQKCGGVRPAIAQIATARAHGLDVMLGCMVETNASIGASCHLAPLADWADLDGSLLLETDPYRGVPLPAGRIAFDGIDVPGTGVEPA